MLQLPLWSPVLWGQCLGRVVCKIVTCLLGSRIRVGLFISSQSLFLRYLSSSSSSSSSSSIQDMHRRVQDPITPHSERLCAYMNDSRPEIVLLYARYFGEHAEATKARMVEVDRNGFLITCQEQGEEHDVRVAFAQPLQTVNQVRDTLMSLAKEAETALHGNKESTQGSAEDELFFLPDVDIVSVSIIVGLFLVFYLDNFPNTTSPALQWILKVFGAKFVHASAVFAIVAHVLEAFASLYFTLIVGQDIFEFSNVIQWFLAVLVFGFKSLGPLIRLTNRQRALRSQR